MPKGFTHESAHNESKEWYTPESIFNALGLTFDMDVASPGKDLVPWIPATRHVTKEENGLTTEWEGRVWLNPPYGHDTPVWAKKFSTYPNGIMFIFSRTDTKWFHDYVIRCDALCFVKGRVRFLKEGNKKGPATAGSLLVANGESCVDALYKSNLGFTVKGRFAEW